MGLLKEAALVFVEGFQQRLGAAAILVDGGGRKKHIKGGN